MSAIVVLAHAPDKVGLWGVAGTSIKGPHPVVSCLVPRTCVHSCRALDCNGPRRFEDVGVRLKNLNPKVVIV